MSDRDWNRLQCGNRTTKQCEQQKTGTRNRLHKYHNTGHQKCVLCTEKEHIPYDISEMCNVHRNRTFSIRFIKNVYSATNRTLSRCYIRNVYRGQKQNTFQMVQQKCVLCTQTEHFPDGASEICTVHRNETLSRRYIRNVYCAQKQHTFQLLHQECVQ